MLSTRGIWHKGWKAATEHGPLIDKGKFDKDRWQLFHVEEDRAEAHDLADKHPEKVKELAELWLARRRNTTFCRSTISASSASTSWNTRRRSRRAADTSITRARRKSRRPRRHARSAIRSRSSPRSSSPAIAGHDLLARLALRRLRDVREGRQARLRLQLPRHSARAALCLPMRRSSASTSSASSSSRRRSARTMKRSAR